MTVRVASSIIIPALSEAEGGDHLICRGGRAFVRCNITVDHLCDVLFCKAEHAMEGKRAQYIAIDAFPFFTGNQMTVKVASCIPILI